MESYLTQVTEYLFTQSWQIAALVAIVALVNLVLRNRSSHVRYLLWLIVLAKCLVPPLLTIPLAVLPVERPITAFEQTVVTAPESSASSPAPVPESPVPKPSEQIIKEKSVRLTTRQWLGLAWGIGVVTFALVAVTKALRTQFWLKRKRKLLPVELQTGIGDLFYSLDLKRFPKVWLVEGIGQPFVWGLLRGGIYLPADFVKVNGAELRRGILGHELSHVLRFDAAVNLLQVIAQALFWFHPFVWWANKRIRAEREKCCDEMAVARLNAKVRDYSNAIVNILVTEHESTRPIPSLAVAGPVKNIEERIKTIMKPGKKFYKRPSLITAIAVMLIAILTVPTALVLTARAAEETTTESEAKPTKSLHEAAADGDLDRVKTLIADGADVNQKDGQGRTALHVASENGCKDVVELLLASGSAVNAKRDGEGLLKGTTPLHEAARSGHKDIVELLIAKGADVNAKNKHGGTPLHYANAKGHEDVAELLLSKGADINIQDNTGLTATDTILFALPDAYKAVKPLVHLLIAQGADVPAIHQAALVGDVNEVLKLLDEGIDVNAKGWHATTPLHVAAFGGHEDLIKVLIDKGADMSAKAEGPMPFRGLTPLHAAIASMDTDVVKLLLANGADINAGYASAGTPLMIAAWLNQIEMAELLIANGADVNGKDEAGMTPLHFAAMLGRKDVIGLLVAKGADVNAKADETGGTPLHYANAKGHKNVAELLISKGADINAKDMDGETPLHLSVREGHKDIVELLLAKNSDVSAKNKWNRTPMDIAVDKGHRQIIELLSKHGVRIVTSEEATALHEAAAVGDVNLVESLILKGADVNAKDGDGQTPLHTAVGRGYKDVAGLLIAKGADVNAKNKWSLTPLSLAEEKRHKEIVELLRKNGAEGAGAPESLRQAAANRDIEKVKSLIPQLEGVKANRNDLAGRRFAFFWTYGVKEHKNVGLLLRDDGTIGEHPNPNESTWEVDEEGRVLIKHRDGRISTVLNKITVHDSKYELRGPFLLRGGIDHILREQ